MRTVRKSADEKLLIQFVWDEDVTASAWATDGGTLSGADYTGNLSEVFFSAGSVGSTYKITNDVTLYSGVIREKSIQVQVVVK